jgi:hypothetical protein
LNTERVEQPVVRQRRDRALRPEASFNVETTHSIGLSVIICATGLLDLAIVIEGSETTSDTCTEAEDRCAAGFELAYDRCGSFASIRTPPGNFRSTPDSRHVDERCRCKLLADSYRAPSASLFDHLIGALQD